MLSNKTVIIIAGPTAVGKTAAAIEVANYFDTEIISADSRQCFKELSIGVARPSGKELAQVPHHFIASHSLTDTVNASTFEHYALQKAKDIFQRKEVLVMAGGTGLYLKAFCEGLDGMPQVPDFLRKQIKEGYETNGLSWLQEEVKKKDPLFFSTGEIQNPQRMMRALEIVTATGESILHFRKAVKAVREFQILKLAMELPREELYQNINRRVEGMMEMGLLQEAEALLPYKHLNALQTVGYKELFDYKEGKTSLDEAVANIKTNTRHYAKRQLTWFKKDPAYKWIDATNFKFHPEWLNLCY